GEESPDDVKELIAKHKAGAQIDWKQADEMLTGQLISRGRELQGETAAMEEKYKSSPREREAHWAGDQVRERGERIRSGDTSSEPPGEKAEPQITKTSALDSVTGPVDISEVPMGLPPANRHAVDSTAPTATVVVAGALLRANEEVVIGRAGDIQVGDSAVSGRHASLRVDENGDTYIRDLGSRNGTYINGERIGPERGEIKLNIGDNVNLGGVHE